VIDFEWEDEFHSNHSIRCPKCKALVVIDSDLSDYYDEGEREHECDCGETFEVQTMVEFTFISKPLKAKEPK
jgi:hypothetical protein